MKEGGAKSSAEGKMRVRESPNIDSGVSRRVARGGGYGRQVCGLKIKKEPGLTKDKKKEGGSFFLRRERKEKHV